MEAEVKEHGNSDCGLHEANSETCNSGGKKDEVDGGSVELSESMELSEGGVGNEDGCVESDRLKDTVDESSAVQVHVKLAETVTVVEEGPRNFSSEVHAENVSFSVQNESLIQKKSLDDISITGVKRARKTIDDQQPSVHVIYNSLSRASKQRLQELLKKWSEWHAENCSSAQDPDQVLESGEETYFPALRIGVEKSSAVSFWIDNQTSNKLNRGFLPLDGSSVPLYDRGYAQGLTSVDGSSNLEGGLEIIGDASRCFNCGSYNHSLKECPKPLDRVAVNNARKQHKTKRNQNPGSRLPTRYYQNSSGGKYDDLKPGVLGAETRQLLGLGELDPPPWLNRMREIGYPPGYLDADDEDQPSGITIYVDGEVKEECEDGEIVEREHPELERKMTVEFPGINAPIPENADERLWAPGPSGSDPSRNRSHHRLNSSSEASSREHHHERRWSGDYRDEGPPGVDPIHSPSRSSYPPRYHGGYDSGYSSYSPRDNFPRPRSPTLGRSQSDRGKRSPLVHEDFAARGLHNSSPYSSSNRYASPRDHGSSKYDKDNYDDRDYDDLDYHSREDYDLDSWHRHRSWR
ncbi:zinc finger CCHC domain-containing protein 8-like isoform X2 [Carica papaya]|uniref:zinc finger CCHC domain-containing protein 8-like isoform X2 n=1 Tax=Carica papaya TaxID=3649 RepID=UPI000B8CC909|nr:zinc finger CCHC domain-containing protein 8-like isoform X2 [Carica papaya]